MKIRVVWASPDLAYTERLLHYMRSSDEGAGWQIHSFTDAEMCRQYVTGRQTSIDLFVIDEAWEGTLKIDFPRTVTLLDTAQSAPGQAVYKYQPLTQLLAQLKSFGRFECKQSAEAPHAENGQPYVAAVYSAAGGTGKTTTSINLLKLAKERRLRTFYLNLEMIQAAKSLGQSSEEDRFARLLYYVQSESRELDYEFEQMKQYDEALGCEYIPGFHHFVNRLEFGSQQVTTVLELIVKSRNYDLVVVDLDSFLHESTIAALQQCDSILWLVTDDVQCVEKTNLAIQALNERNDEAESVSKKITFILNKHTGTIANDMSSIPITYKLPYIPQWKSMSSITSFDQAPIFTNQLQQLLKAWFSRSAVMVFGSEAT